MFHTVVRATTGRMYVKTGDERSLLRCGTRIEVTLSIATATIDQVDPFRAICRKGRSQGKILGWIVCFQEVHSCGGEKEMVMQMTKMVSNTASMTSRQRKLHCIW